MLKLTFPSYFFPTRLVCCYLDPSFLLFLLSLESLRKLYVEAILLPADFPNFLFYPILTSPAWVIPSSSILCRYLKFQLPPFAITLSALPSLYFYLSECWVGSRNQGDQ